MIPVTRYSFTRSIYYTAYECKSILYSSSCKCILQFAFPEQEEIAKDLLSGDDEETQSSADDLTPSVTSHETTDFFPRTLRCKSFANK